MKKQIVKNNYLTKDYLDKRLDKVIKYIDLRFEAVDEKLKKLDTVDERLNRIMKQLDWLVGEYKKFDEEHMILTNKYTPLNEKLENHETRISSLEQKTTSI